MQRDPTTVILPQGTQENVMVLRYGGEILDELDGLIKAKQLYDVVVIDVSQTGFDFAADDLIEASDRAKKILTLQGGMVFARADKAIAIVRETVMGNLALHIFHSLSELYDYSALFARHVRSALGESQTDKLEATDLSQQVLMSSIPVLTQFGIKLKAGMDSARRRNLVLGAVDSYTPITALSEHLAAKSLSLEDLLDELKALEQMRAIYPIFPRIPFLVNCFRNQLPFNLREYMISSQLLTTDQLEEIAFDQQNTRGKERMSVGALAVSKGMLSTRQYEIVLQDMAFYGQNREVEKVKLMTSEQQLVSSIVGHLGTTDPAGLLQNLSTNRESGVLSVENREMHFRAVFEGGKVTHARLNKIRGNNAVIEFVSVWTEGMFVFMQRQAPPDLMQDACKTTKALDKLLLDSALAQDNIHVVWKKLPKGDTSQLEKWEDKENLLGGKITDPQTNKHISHKEQEIMQRVWQGLNGLTPLSAVVRILGDVPTYAAAEAVDRLLHYRLAGVPANDVAGPLNKFKQIVRDVGQKIGGERNLALLRLSLQAAQGYSVRARMFNISASGEVSLDVVAARSAGWSLSIILKDLEDWQVKYVEYVSQELDRNILRDIVYKAHQTA